MRTMLRRSLILTMLAVFCLSASAFAQGDGPGGRAPQAKAKTSCQQSQGGLAPRQEMHQAQHQNHKAHQHAIQAQHKNHKPKPHKAVAMHKNHKAQHPVQGKVHNNYHSVTIIKTGYNNR